MEYKKLGARGPVISTVGFGAWGISGRDWGTTDDGKSRKAIETAIDSGVTFIDTADVYSTWGPGHQGGESETVIGKWLRASGKRSRVVLATKVGKPMGPGPVCCRGRSGGYKTAQWLFSLG